MNCDYKEMKTKPKGNLKNFQLCPQEQRAQLKAQSKMALHYKLHPQGYKVKSVQCLFLFVLSIKSFC